MAEAADTTTADPPLRVLHVGKYFAPFAGGIEQFMRDLMLAQQRRGHTVAAVVHHHDAAAPTVDETVDGLPICRVRTHGAALYAPVSPMFGRHLRKTIAQFKPDVLHIHMPNLSAFWMHLQGQAKRVPWVAHWHSDVAFPDADWRMAAAYRVYRPFERKLLARSRAIIATSPPYLASSAALKPHHDRCHVVPLGVDRARLPEPTDDDLAWAREQWPRDTLRVLTIGRLTYYKGHRYLLDAVAKTQNVSACIAGRGDQDEPLRKQAAGLELASRANFAGFVADERARALLATCDVFCLPSLERTEAFGVVLMEAMRFGRPLVACDIDGSGVTWVVQHERNGLLVPTHDADALGGALARLRDDVALRERFGAAGRARYDSEFDIDRVAEAVDSVYASFRT